LEGTLAAYVVPVPVVTEVIEDDEGTMAPIVAEGFGDVESPGGSTVCVLPVRICEKLNMGEVLKPEEFLRMATAARADIDRFVASKLFDSFAGPWESILRSLLVDDVAILVVRRGIAGDVYAIVDKMRARFGLELCSVLAYSHVFKTSFLKVFRKAPSVDETMRAIRRGNFNGIAQTDGFIQRVKLLKDLVDEVLLKAEQQNVFLPTYITGAQRALPLRSSGRLGYVGDTVFPMPDVTSKKLLENGGKGRAGSFDTKRAGW